MTLNAHVLLRKIKPLFCDHKYRCIAPNVCFGGGRFGSVCKCDKCGKVKSF